MSSKCYKKIHNDILTIRREAWTSGVFAVERAHDHGQMLPKVLNQVVMMMFRALLRCVALICVFASCGKSSIPFPASPELSSEVTPAMNAYPVYRDPSTLVEVKVGDVFVLALDANPSTGYQWQLTQPPDSLTIQPQGSTYHPPATMVPGAVGSEEWMFRAVGTGQTTIVLSYVRAWEKDAVRVAAFRVGVSK